jgi:hypothetical protein
VPPIKRGPSDRLHASIGYLAPTAAPMAVPLPFQKVSLLIVAITAPPPVISAVRLLAPPAVQGAQLFTRGKQGIIPGKTVLQFSLVPAVTLAQER